MRKKSNAGLYAVLGLLVALIIGIVIFVFMNKKEVAPEPEDLSGRELAQHAVSYEKDGVLRLYDVKEGKEIQKFDLKTISDVEVKKVTKVVKEEIKKPKKEPKKKEGLGGYKDFDQIRVTIVKHDNAWNIQTALTPKRNTTEMLRYVRELNDGYAMHPIFPGEQYIFLKEKGDKDIDEEGIGIVIEEVIEEPTFVEKTVEEEVEKRETEYTFYRDFENGTVYAHSDFNKMIYKIEVDEEAKGLQVDKYLKHEDIGSPSKFIVQDSHVLFGYQEDQTIYHLHDKKIKKVKLEGVPEVWKATDKQLVYAFGDFMGSYSLQDGKQNKALLGDATKSMVVQGKDAYVLNRFGEKSENNLLLKVDTNTLDVEDLVELDSNKTALVSEGDGEFVWISGVKMTGSKTGERMEEPQIMTFAKDPFKEDKKNGWAMEAVHEGQTYDAHLYAREGEALRVYREKSDKPIVEFSVKGDEYLIIK